MFIQGECGVEVGDEVDELGGCVLARGEEEVLQGVGEVQELGAGSLHC